MTQESFKRKLAATPSTDVLCFLDKLPLATYIFGGCQTNPPKINELKFYKYQYIIIHWR